MIGAMTSPRVLDGADVLATADVSASSGAGGTRHFRDGELVNRQIARLAVCRYPDEPHIYLFYCDADWAVLTDTMHDSFDAALGQAHFEYEDVSFTRSSEPPDDG
jgi:hypothetical protein